MALDAVTRGLERGAARGRRPGEWDVALVQQLVHGGLRYLAKGDPAVAGALPSAPSSPAAWLLTWSIHWPYRWC